MKEGQSRAVGADHSRGRLQEFTPAPCQHGLLDVEGGREERTRAKLEREKRKRCQTRKSPLEGNLCEFASWWGKLCLASIVSFPRITFPDLRSPISFDQINLRHSTFPFLVFIGQRIEVVTEGILGEETGVSHSQTYSVYGQGFPVSKLSWDHNILYARRHLLVQMLERDSKHMWGDGAHRLQLE